MTFMDSIPVKLLIFILVMSSSFASFGADDAKVGQFKAEYEIVDNKIVKIKIKNDSEKPIVLCLMKYLPEQIVLFYKVTLTDYNEIKYSSPDVRFPQTEVPKKQFQYIYMFGGDCYEFSPIKSDVDIKNVDDLIIGIKYFDPSNLEKIESTGKFDYQSIILMNNTK